MADTWCLYVLLRPLVCYCVVEKERKFYAMRHHDYMVRACLVVIANVSKLHADWHGSLVSASEQAEENKAPALLTVRQLFVGHMHVLRMSACVLHHVHRYRP